MNYSPNNKPLISYIPGFLEYCEKEKHLSPISIENYNQFLNRFIVWLKQSNLISLSPAKLSVRRIQEYKDYLSKRTSSETRQSLSKKTQNYYLIALRALLSYFIEKDILSLLPHKIKLLKEEKSRNLNEFVNLDHFKKLLEIPNTSTIQGIRDKALLETLFSTGLKVSQLAALNKNQVEINSGIKKLEIKVSDKKDFYPRTVYLSEKAVNSLRKYLETRKDKEKALFINYKNKKGTSRRLTVRSIEKSIKRYAKIGNLSTLLTPETLRNVRVLNLLEQEKNIKISQRLFIHKTLIVNTYNKFVYDESLWFKENIKISKQSPPWHTVEQIIEKEIVWLKNNLSILPEGYKPKYTLINCDGCLLRKIAILIASGEIKAIEFKTKRGKNLWKGLTQQEMFQKTSKHGKEWHRKMMDVIFGYFELQNCKTIAEPILNHGRADLGVYLNSKSPLYVEVGTVSLYKLWYNFLTMKNVSFLLVPSEDYAIEFRT